MSCADLIAELTFENYKVSTCSYYWAKTVHFVKKIILKTFKLKRSFKSSLLLVICVFLHEKSRFLYDVCLSLVRVSLVFEQTYIYVTGNPDIVAQSTFSTNSVAISTSGKKILKLEFVSKLPWQS